MVRSPAARSSPILTARRRYPHPTCRVSRRLKAAGCLVELGHDVARPVNLITPPQPACVQRPRRRHRRILSGCQFDRASPHQQKFFAPRTTIRRLCHHPASMPLVIVGSDEGDLL